MPHARHAALALFFVVCTFAGVRPALAQPTQGEPPADTRTRLAELERQIELDETRVSNTTETVDVSLEALDDLNREIAIRSELSDTYRQRLSEISLQADSLRLALMNLQEEVESAKAQYRGRAVHAYKYGRLHDLALIVASTSINQMLIRARYLQRFGAQRERKLGEVLRISRLLKQREEELVSSQSETRQLLQKAEEEERSLRLLRREREKLILRLRDERSLIEREMRRKQLQHEALAALVRGLTRETPARTAKSEQAARTPATGPVLNGSLVSNKGRLPWPAPGAVQEPFGDRVNPVLGTTTTNPGILIATAAGAEVRAIFDGEVIHVDVMPDFGTVVTIDHGDYKSVLANFSALDVKPGDEVRAGSILGRAGTGDQPKGAGIFLAMFHNGRPVDPVPWLSPRR